MHAWPMEIVWDERKRQQNLAKHGLDFADLSLEFFAAGVTGHAKHGRLKVVGVLSGRLVIAVIFKSLGTQAVSIVSMRRANRLERSVLWV